VRRCFARCSRGVIPGNHIIRIEEVAHIVNSAEAGAIAQNHQDLAIRPQVPGHFLIVLIADGAFQDADITGSKLS